MAASKLVYSLLLASYCAVISHDVAAMVVVINAPRFQTIPSPTLSATPPLSPSVPPPATTTRTQFRIRRTRAADLDAIATMLATATNPSSAGAHDWNDKMARLRAAPLLKNQLTHRLAVIEEGRATARLTDGVALCTLSADAEDMDTCELLWSNRDFKAKLRNAIHNTQETTAWMSHNFDVLPSSEMLRHTMMSVEAPGSGEVVGFCEIGWLPSPIASCAFPDYSGAGLQRHSEDEGQRIRAGNEALDIPNSHYEETPHSYCDIYDDKAWQCESTSSAQCAPAILNLVTSPSHRRMGIASRVLHFASKYTRSQWCCHDTATSLGLYVQSDNVNAMRLYRRHGFSVVPSSEADGSLLYMTQTN